MVLYIEGYNEVTNLNPILMKELMIIMNGSPMDYQKFREELDRYFDSNHKTIDYSCGYQLDAKVFDVVFNVEDKHIDLVKEATRVVADVLDIKVVQITQTNI